MKRAVEYQREAAALLKEGGIAEGELEARMLFTQAFGWDFGTWILEKDNQEIQESDPRLRQFFAWVGERLTRRPIQYILHSQDFYGLPLYVNENVLIPRQDTEVLVEAVLHWAKSRPPDTLEVLDLCTGSGAIALALEKNGRFKGVAGLDISPKALEVAKRNSAFLKAGVSWILGDMFTGLTENQKYDIIVSNPPYIRSQVIDTLLPEVRDFEPRLALDGDGDGLRFYRILAREAGGFLKKKGLLALEIGFDQGEEVRELCLETGFARVTVEKDLAGLDRVILAETDIEDQYV